jgi:transposase
MNEKTMTREQRGQLIAENARIIKTEQGWIIPSQSSSQKYLVSFNGEKPECNCPDCKLRQNKCKHIHAVEFYIKKEINKEGIISEMRRIKIYSQDWKAYDFSQINEKTLFTKLLFDLCQNVKQPIYKFGRPIIPFQDLMFSAVMKIYTTFSLRRFMSDMKIAQQEQYINKVPCFASIGHFLQKEEITPILKELITITSLPLKNVETDFAIDSSGFSTNRFAKWFDYKWGKDNKEKVWLKAHLISGIKTHIITGCEITEAYCNDSPELSKLIKQTAKHFKLNEISADKAYSSRENLETISKFGANPFIPFKKNASGKSRGSLIWKKMYHYFLYKNEEFLEHYGKRSNSETVFHMIKTKFRDNLRSKTKTAQINELLCKILCHNICVVIQEMNELGITPNFFK